MMVRVVMRAQLSFPEAGLHFGVMVMTRIGGDGDLRAAAFAALKSTAAAIPEAAYYLARCHAAGVGTTVDRKAAAQEYVRAARSPNSDLVRLIPWLADKNVAEGICYERGY